MASPSPDIGLARLNSAMEFAAQAGDLMGWLIAAGTIYDRTKNDGRTEIELRVARRSLLQRVNGLRAHSRSRVGRLWAAQQVQARLCELYLDEVATTSPEVKLLWELLESSKSRTLLDHLGSTYRELPDLDERQRIRTVEKQILSLKGEAAPGSMQREMQLLSSLPIQETKILSFVQQSIKTVEAAYQKADAGFNTADSITSIENIQLVLRSDEVFINYMVVTHANHPAFSLQALLITRQDVLRIELDLTTELASIGGFAGSFIKNGGAPLETSQLAALIFACRAQIQAGDDSEAQVRLQRLFDLLFQPALNAGVNPLLHKHWIVSPSRALHAVPWSAVLMLGGQPALDDVAITLAPSASVWHHLRKSSASTPTSLLAFGNPMPLPDPGLAALPQAEIEVTLAASTLHDYLDCTPLTREDATEAALRANIGEASIVHFATHGGFPEQDAIDFHELFLAAGDGCDGCVLAEELRSMSFQNASLVVLSICNGGLYRFGPGDEPYGLVPAILAAGALNVIGPLWSVADDKARKFMTSFYSYLIEHGPARALQLTYRELAGDGWLPRDWAAFVLIGAGATFPEIGPAPEASHADV